jgi:hypothetical protein
MATLREMISSIKELVNAYSDDTTLSNEHLAFLIQNKRATYLEVISANPRKKMPTEAYQTLKLNMKALPDCEDEYIILSSLETLPQTINNDNDIEGIGKVYLPSILAKWINIIGLERAPFILSGGRFNSKQLYVTKSKEDNVLLFNVVNSHVFVTEIYVDILATNPEEADILNSEIIYDAEGDPICDFYDKPYPLPEGLVKAVVMETAKELILKYQAGKDVENNGADDNIKAKIPYYGPRRQQPEQQQEES